MRVRVCVRVKKERGGGGGYYTLVLHVNRFSSHIQAIAVKVRNTPGEIRA